MENQSEDLAYIKNFFLNDAVEISLQNFFIAILLSTILAFVIKKIYIQTSQSLSNKEYFSDLFIPLSIVTCLVITVIKFSLALSLGLVGALSIVRFRAAIKEPEELIYLFLIIGIGLASGANQFLVAIIATIFVSVILLIFSKYRRTNNDTNTISTNVIQIEIKNKKVSFEKIINELKKHCDYLNLKSTTITNNNEIYIFWVEIKNRSSLNKTINTLRNLSNNNISISLFSSENIHE